MDDKTKDIAANITRILYYIVTLGTTPTIMNAIKRIGNAEEPDWNAIRNEGNDVNDLIQKTK